MKDTLLNKLFGKIDSTLFYNFWFLNTAFWVGYGLIFLPFAFAVYGNVYPKPVLHFSHVIFGFGITCLIRIVYTLINLSQTGIIKISFMIALLSFAGLMLWFRLDDLLRVIFFGWEKGIKNDSVWDMVYEVIWNTPILLGWSAFYFVLKLWVEWNLQKEKTEKSDAIAVKANLESLRYQLNPHFLFNSLSTLRVLIGRDPAKAKDMLLKISDFLRYTLTDNTRTETTLSEEIEAIQNYLEIEKVRLGDKLDISYIIDPAAKNYTIPAFLLNPLIENSVKHGIFKENKLSIVFECSLIENNALQIRFTNTGSLARINNDTTNVGLANVQKRLELMYPSKHSFEIKESEGNVITTLIIKKTNAVIK